MSTAVTHSPANQDRPLLLHPPRRSSDQRRIRTLLDLLTIEKMDGVDRTAMMRQASGTNISRWKTLRERLGLNAIGCCGIATWHTDNNSSIPENEDENNTATDHHVNNQNNNNNNNDNVVLQEGASHVAATRQRGEDNEAVGPTMNNMNLAAALAAERQYRAAESTTTTPAEINGSGDTTPSRVSLMRLLEETSDGCDLERENNQSLLSSSSDGGGGGGSGGGGTVCCVCMGREKGAAFIPCGHTYCRVCSRELWLNRGSCPLCNRRILEILDIF